MHSIWQISKSKAIWLGFVTLIIFNTLYYLQGFIISKFAADLFALALLTYMTTFTTSDAFKALRSGLNSAAHRFVFSFWLIFALSLTHRLWILILALAQKANGGERYAPLYESPISGNIAILIGLAAIYGAVAPFTGPIKVARSGYITMIISTGIACIVVGIAIGVYIIGGWID